MLICFIQVVVEGKFKIHVGICILQQLEDCGGYMISFEVFSCEIVVLLIIMALRIAKVVAYVAKELSAALTLQQLFRR